LRPSWVPLGPLLPEVLLRGVLLPPEVLPQGAPPQGRVRWAQQGPERLPRVEPQREQGPQVQEPRGPGRLVQVFWGAP
jgi:hypothetical protein